MSDIEKSFTFLHDNIPQWFVQLAEIEEKVARMRNEISKVPVSRSLPMRRKTGSVESIRDLDAVLEERSASTPMQQSPFATRKRKPASVLSGQGSGALKYRSRTMIIVYYDGQIQKSFETLVRNVGTGRNMLRKGKMAAKMEAFAELAGSDSDGSDDDVTAKIGYRPRPGFASMRSRAGARGERGGDDPSEVFDSTDKALETAQGLCEKAAHQSLRDGDCRKELDLVKKHFEGVLETATKEVAKYIGRKEMAAAVEASKLETSTPTPTRIEAKPLLPDIRPAVAVAATTAKAVDIEVDDDTDDDDFVMPPIRLTSRA
ncbi:hypothetical protein EJ04DRAFT_9137 [Polyplosphaeria fusca]|uniref:Uncharacterized protein n=1 Tax=Polyplosphaeria fusca TaxID=682080 RepID=A0A9P4V787_9PLEO|nr:hypothetical protein EJ04DRAFT_9137 [Polyplosphaeria fusca]